jgi:hypothetical protein
MWLPQGPQEWEQLQQAVLASEEGMLQAWAPDKLPCQTQLLWLAVNHHWKSGCLARPAGPVVFLLLLIVLSVRRLPPAVQDWWRQCSSSSSWCRECECVRGAAHVKLTAHGCGNTGDAVWCSRPVVQQLNVGRTGVTKTFVAAVDFC